jgi:hypothetical protein
MEQTIGFQSFRTRSFLRENGEVSMVLESQCFHGVGVVCLFHFSELQPLFLIAT